MKHKFLLPTQKRGFGVNCLLNLWVQISQGTGLTISSSKFTILTSSNQIASGSGTVLRKVHFSFSFFTSKDLLVSYLAIVQSMQFKAERGIYKFLSEIQ
jgi:hypothetical protein